MNPIHPGSARGIVLNVDAGKVRCRRAQLRRYKEKQIEAV
jgi:hypothetical protein